MKRFLIATLVAALANIASLAPECSPASVRGAEANSAEAAEAKSTKAAEAKNVGAKNAEVKAANRGLLEHAWFNKYAVRLELDGVLAGVVRRHTDSGVLVGAPKVRVYLYSNGQLIRVTRTDDEGNFQALVNPGVYSIMAGDLGDQNGFAGTMIHVLPPMPHVPAPLPDTRSVSAPGDLPPPAPALGQIGRSSPKRLELCLIDPPDVAKLRSLLVQIWRNRRPVQSAAGPAVQNQPQPPRDLFALLGGQTRLGGQAAEAEPQKPALAFASAVLEADDLNRLKSIPFDGPWHLGHKLFIHMDGSLRGRMRTINNDGSLKPASGLDVRLLRRARPTSITQGHATTSADGSFRVNDVDPGVYSMIAVSPAGGFGAFGVRLVAGAVPGEAVPQPPTRSVTVRNVSFPGEFVAQVEGEGGDGDDVDTSVVNDTDGNAFLANGALNGLGNNLPAGGTITGGPGGGAAGGDPLAAALLGAGLGALAGYGIAEATSSY